jgi:uncharacterized membrane protein YedE/YeeE
MSEESVMGGKIKELYKILCQSEWNATATGLIVAFFSVIIMAWSRPWGAVGAIRNWGEWILYGVGYLGQAPKSVFLDSGSIIGLGFIGGAFVSACLGGQFALRFPPLREYVKAIIAGIFMGVGSALAGGCNVGGMYNAIGNLAANGFSMWLGLVIGVVCGLWLIYKEMEYVTWGDGGAATVDIPGAVQAILGLVAIALLAWGAYSFASNAAAKISTLSAILLIAAALGYAMQRGRWCMVQGFREPHMTGDCTLAKSVALSILFVAIGGAILKSGVDPVLEPVQYVRGTFGWGGVVGGFIFGLGAMMAGGCGSGSLWRVGEGQIKLWVVVPIFGIANSLMTRWFQGMEFTISGNGLKGLLTQARYELIDYTPEQINEAISSGGSLTITGMEQAGKLGSYVFMPDALGFGMTIMLIGLIMALWFVVVTWNEETNKLIVPM